MAEPKQADEFEAKDSDSAYVKSLKSHAKSLCEHISKREKLVKSATGEESSNHAQTIAEERARLASIKKELGTAK